MPPTKQECEAQAKAEVARWLEALGLLGEWRWTFKFVGADDDGDMADNAAQVAFNASHRIVQVRFTPRLRQAYYPLEAVHECLHVLFYPLQLAVNALEEPAKALLDDRLHMTLDRLARTLAGMSPMDSEEMEADHAPWESLTPPSTPTPDPVPLEELGAGPARGFVGGSLLPPHPIGPPAATPPAGIVGDDAQDGFLPVPADAEGKAPQP